MEHFTLCGIKHSGKSTLGKILAEKLYLPFYDTDEVLRKMYFTQNGQTKTVREIYQELGADAFRQLEMTAVRSLAETDCVMALGGGTLSNPYFTADDRKILGTLCCIEADDRVAFDRIAAEGLPPFLAGEGDPFAAFCRDNENRRRVFRQHADFIFTADPAQSPDKNADQIIRRINSHE